MTKKVNIAWESQKENLFVGVAKIGTLPDKYCKIEAVNVDVDVYMWLLLDEGIAKVTPEFFRFWDVTEDQAFDVAMENTRKTIIKRSMRQLMREMGGVEMPDDAPDQTVVMNGAGYLGGAAILFDEVFTEIAKQTGADRLAVLPSSIHELIVMPWDGTIEELNEMVNGVNATKVASEEQLADHAYIFKEGELTW